jgi:hypothetical protein
MITNDFMSLLKEQKVVIPQIQRDYAQGRTTNEVSRIRERFLDKLCVVLQGSYQGEPLKLDFIYGYTTKDVSDVGKTHTIFKPLDGQQRLTTLFLLHWFVAVKEGRSEDEINLLSKFSYATREKSRSFCENLVRFRPHVDSAERHADSVKKQIEDQAWFFLSWASDPTISGMLVMLDSIESKYKENNLQDVWPKLTGENSSVIFYLLNMDDLGLPEDLYIKMNSRGKPLTQFEHFKAQFSRIIPSELAGEFNTKIDKEWSDLFWYIYKNESDDGDDLAARVDNSFLNFYNYVTDLIIATEGIHVDNTYWLKVAELVYSKKENVLFFFKCLNTFVTQQKEKPAYFDQLFYINKDQFSAEKVRLFFNSPQTNIFHKCARVYRQVEGRNPFSIGEQLLFYACLVNLQEDLERFPENLRKIRNLIASSEDQMRKEYLGILFNDVNDIIHNKPLSDRSRFSRHQVEEESLKRSLLEQYSDKKEAIHRIEDHDLLRGSILILDINESITKVAESFHTTFSESSCDYYSISLNMLSIGDYSQGYGGGGRRRLGNGNASTWRELFTPSEKRSGFEKTREVLTEYLSKGSDEGHDNHSNPAGPEKAVIDWRYYYRKYKSFRKWGGESTDGFYHWSDFEHKPFECFMMFKSQFNGRHWNPFLLEISSLNSNCSLENYGNNLHFRFGQVMFIVGMDNEKFKFMTLEEDTESNDWLNKCIEQGLLAGEGILLIEQVNDLEDKADRIELCLVVLKKIEVLISRKEIS